MQRQALGAPILVSLTFDDSIDDTVPKDQRVGDQWLNRPEDDISRAVGSAVDRPWGVLTDGDTVHDETACPNVALTSKLGDPPLPNEQLHCDLPATFYLNFPRLDDKDFLTQSLVQDMESWGHEIGGHSSHHHVVPKLHSDSATAVNLAEQRLQLCWDRRNLSRIARRGGGSFDITTFAYPLGEYTWKGEDALVSAARFGPMDPAVGPVETRNIVGIAASECGYRAARATGGVANAKECTDLNVNTPCRWAERYPVDDAGVPPPDGGASGIWSLATPSSIGKDTALDYDGGADGGWAAFDTQAEYESRAHSIYGWLDNAVANPAPGGQRQWLILVFHSICYVRGCNRYGIYWEDFRALLSRLRQMRKLGQIEVKTVADVLGHTGERVVNVPVAAAQPTIVRNRRMSSSGTKPDGDINRDYLPDCYQQAGVESRATLADRDGGNSPSNTNYTYNGGWYAWLWLNTQTASAEGEFYTRKDHARCALKVKPGNTYRVSFAYRAANPTRVCPFEAGSGLAPCPIPVASAPAGAALAAGGDELPFGYVGDDQRMYEVEEEPAPAQAAQAAAVVTAAGTPLYRLIYAWRKPNADPATGNATPTHDGHWMPWNVVEAQDLELLPTRAWQVASWTVVAPNNGVSPNNYIADSLSFGVHLSRNGAVGRVGLDVDDFDYCRVTNDPTDPVLACPN